MNAGIRLRLSPRFVTLSAPSNRGTLRHCAVPKEICVSCMHSVLTFFFAMHAALVLLSRFFLIVSCVVFALLVDCSTQDPAECSCRAYS